MPLSIGLMSGTSMDGIDVALLETDGESHVIHKGHHHLAYHRDFHIALKSAEYIVRKHQGDLVNATQHFDEDLKEFLRLKLKLSIMEIHEFRKFSLQSIIAHSTELHSQAVESLLKKLTTHAEQIDVIGYHGQTLYHQPQFMRSIIVGNAQLLANTVNIPVVHQFRANDIAAGGQGAPFAPIYHWALAKRDNILPCAVVNCGGIANVTIITDEDPETLLAFDTGPGNGLIDTFIRQKTHGKESMDKEGLHGQNGKVHHSILQELYQTCMQENKKNFFTQTPPKSLDIGDFILPEVLNDLSLEDACRTLEAFTADSIIHSIKHATNTMPKLWIVAGGGWNNPVILQEFTTRLQKIAPHAIVKTAHDMGWHNTALEAEIFAYLAIRHLKQLPFSFPGTTGVTRPVTGGMYCEPNMVVS